MEMGTRLSQPASSAAFSVRAVLRSTPKLFSQSLEDCLERFFELTQGLLKTVRRGTDSPPFENLAASIDDRDLGSGLVSVHADKEHRFTS